MSYWYGKVAEIYLKSGTQDVWLEIQWYYRQVNLQDEDIESRQYLAVQQRGYIITTDASWYTLHLVDHRYTVLKAWSYFVHRRGEHTDVDVINVVPHFSPQPLSGDIAGNAVTGSTRNVLPLWDIPWVAIKGQELVEEARTLGQLPQEWKDNVPQAMLPTADQTIPRYYCLNCKTAITPMHPSCDLIEWNVRDVQQLLKVKGTIQDIDGECSLKEKCKDHDICGAIQGSGGGEDMEILLNIIDACVNSSIDEGSTASSISVAQMTVVSVDTDVSISDIPFAIQYESSDFLSPPLVLTHVKLSLVALVGLNDNDPSDNLVANGLLVTAKSSEEYLEIFGMAEMMATCHELSADRGAMSRFFTAAGRALYVSRTGKECVVEYGQPVQSMDELSHRAALQ
ncbi:hypothetical protein C8R48DRAFT_673946 [Suillus tomentosus]|nr:hypothetical protein C8R48DRAFT_673946 [Suillus tomentosus]